MIKDSEHKKSGFDQFRGLGIKVSYIKHIKINLCSNPEWILIKTIAIFRFKVTSKSNREDQSHL